MPAACAGVNPTGEGCVAGIVQEAQLQGKPEAVLCAAPLVNDRLLPIIQYVVPCDLRRGDWRRKHGNQLGRP